MPSKTDWELVESCSNRSAGCQEFSTVSHTGDVPSLLPQVSAPIAPFLKARRLRCVPGYAYSLPYELPLTPLCPQPTIPFPLILMSLTYAEPLSSRPLSRFNFDLSSHMSLPFLFGGHAEGGILVLGCCWLGYFGWRLAFLTSLCLVTMAKRFSNCFYVSSLS